MPASGKPDKCVQAQPKRSWQFEGKHSKDDKVLAATGNALVMQLLATDSITLQCNNNSDRTPEKFRNGLEVA
jgi:hypothetical protein